MNESRATRRRFLLAAGASALSGLAGCNGDGLESGDQTARATPSTTETIPDTETADRTASTENGAVAMFRYDAANTGAREDGVGPKSDAEVDWRVELDGSVWSSPAVVDGSVYVASRAGTVYALDADSGDVDWTADASDTVLSSPAVVGDAVYVGTLGDTVRAFAEDTGDQRWKFETDGPVVSSPTVVNGRVFVGAHDGRVYALDAASGDEAWRFEPMEASSDIPSGVGTRADWSDRSAEHPGIDDLSQPSTVPVSTPAVVDDTVYVKRASSLVAISFEAGREEWSRSLDDQSAGDHRSSMGGTIDSSHSDRDRYADLLQVSHGMPGSPAVVDGTVYAGEYPDLHAVDANGGDHRWSAGSRAALAAFETFDATAGFQVHYSAVSSPAVTSGTAYTGGDGVSAVAVDSGERDWETRLDGEIRSSPAVVGDTVYAGTDGGSVSALAVDDGEERWSVETEGAVISSPAVLDGTVYVGSDDGFVYALAEP